MKNKTRKSNIEALRIVAILLIISFHYCYKGGFSYDGVSFNGVVLKTFWMFGEWGVNIFMLITGYFMCENEFKIKRLVSILLQVQFYTLLTYFISYRLGMASIMSVKDVILLFLPVITNRYWFVTVYVLIYILTPYINRFLSVMNDSDLRRFLKITLFLWCVIPTIVGAFYNSTEVLLYYNRFIWYIEMYCLGAYYKKYGSLVLKRRSECGVGIIISIILLVSSIIIISKNIDFFGRIGVTEPAYFWPPNSILLLLISACTFLWFEKTEMKNSGFINLMASGTLGVYMLHDGALSGWLWWYVFKNATHQESIYLVGHILVATLFIFIIGTVLDLLRQQIEGGIWRLIGILRHDGY